MTWEKLCRVVFLSLVLALVTYEGLRYWWPDRHRRPWYVFFFVAMGLWAAVAAAWAAIRFVKGG